MRELRVEDALIYLDQVKVEFGDRPHIYNEFLEIMKTFKTQQIDTPGVIRRVSNLFKGNRKLVLGFNTFLPEGYQIELPSDGNGPPVAVYRAPGSDIAQILREGESPTIPPALPANPPAQPAPSAAQSHASVAAQLPHAQIRHPSLAAAPAAAHAPRLGQATEPFGQKAISASGVPAPPTAQPPMLARERSSHALEQRQPAPQHLSPPGPNHRLATPKQVPSTQSLQPASGMRDEKLSQVGQVSAMGASQQPVSQPVNGNGAAPRRPAPAAVESRPAQAQPQQQQAAAAPAAQAQPPMEFDHAINYVTTIKKRFATEPEIYKKFLEILHTYQKEQRGIKDVLEEVSKLFADHPDLLKEFTYFLPDNVQAQAKAQLDQVAKEAEARKASQAKQAIMSTSQEVRKQAQSSGRQREPEFDRKTVKIPFGALQGRTEDQEQSIIRSAQRGVVSFNPIRPPRRDELPPAKAAMKVARPVTIPPLPKQPNSTETAFFQKIKKHLERRELKSERPAGPRRHTPYVEFLKCLHLFSANIINRDELLLLLKNLVTHGHAPKSGANSNVGAASSIASDANDLMRELEEILVSRGPYADQEASMKDRSKYGALRTRDFDFSSSENPTPSYFRYPADYPHSLFVSHPGQTKLDRGELKDMVVCVGKVNGKRKRNCLEEYDAVADRRNDYEEALMRIEDERYEIDMAIERNAQALRQVEPLAEEAKALREQEEKDGQPIGRLQYRLNRQSLNSVHINSIARIYGDRGDMVLQHMLRNPLVVLPIVYQRLKQKDTEWRKVKADLTAKLNAISAANYEGGLDVQCHFQRRELEKRGLGSRLRDECVRARQYGENRESESPVTKKFAPTCGRTYSDPEALLFQPHLCLNGKLDPCHRDAFQVIEASIHCNSNLTDVLREQICRVWAEFVAPWFNFPPFWIAEHMRKNLSGMSNSNMVIFSPGQRIVTIVGEGTVVAFSKHDSNGMRKYRVKLPFGMAYLSPSAILYAQPSKDTPFVRRDGQMVRDEAIVKELSSQVHLGSRYQILFGTEPIYMLMRHFSFLVAILKEIRRECTSEPRPVDPAENYVDSFSGENKKHRRKNRLDYLSVLECLKRVISGKMDPKAYESFGRIVSKTAVHQMAALPKYVTRCSTALINVAKEDALLHLYDYCHHQGVDPEIVRTHCFAVAPDASYRIQYNKSTGDMFFSYIPMGKPLLVTPAENSKHETEDEHMTESDGSQRDDDDAYMEDSHDVRPPWKKSRIR